MRTGNGVVGLGRGSVAVLLVVSLGVVFCAPHAGASEAPSRSQAEESQAREGAASGEAVEIVEAGHADAPSGLAEYYRTVRELRNSELRARLDELWELDRRTTMDVAVLCGGRDLPTFLTAARRSVRLAMREEAREWVSLRASADAEARAEWDERLALQVRPARPATFHAIWPGTIAVVNAIQAQGQG